MNEEVKRLMLNLGEAINGSLSDSDRLAKAVANVRAAGYNVFLVLEATIAFSERNDGQGPPNPKNLGPKTSFTNFDERLLRDFRIGLGNTESEE